MSNVTQTMDNFNNASSRDYFSAAFENGPVKIGIVVAYFISALVIIPGAYGVIWYEHFGSDHKRILLNRLVSSICWSGIEYYTLVQWIEVTRYTFGPLNETVCLIHLTLKNAIHMQTILFIDIIAFVRYLFMFWLKNTFGFQDEFWSRFVNIWVFGFSTISQFSFVFLPGRQPLNFYLCTGKDPTWFGCLTYFESFKLVQ
jgi:hypothetical protein